MNKILIIGYGNPLREDDGLGWLAACQLAVEFRGSPVEVRPCHQLNPELSERIAKADLVIFIDATVDGKPGEIQSRSISPVPMDPGSFSHDLDPAALVECAGILFGKRPEAVVYTVAGEQFGFGETLSPTVETALPRLLDQVRKRIREVLHTPKVAPTPDRSDNRNSSTGGVTIEPRCHRK